MTHPARQRIEKANRITESVMEKVCSRCDDAKPLDQFYAVPGGVLGRMPYCKKCDNARQRPASQNRMNRNRARHRAVADLIDMHREDFETLLAIRLHEANDEAEALALTPEADDLDGEPVRLLPGRRMPGETVEDRVNTARCQHCAKHHDRGHVCESCGVAPGQPPRHLSEVSRNKNLETSQTRPIPSGVRQHRTSVDPAALVEFNAGVGRARSAAR